MRVLIVGGGICGLTLAGLLRQRGFRPTLVERASEYGSIGYIIVLWPSGSRVLKGLGLYRKLLDAGLPFSTYNVWNEKGEMLRSYSVESVTEKYGPMISIYRPELVDILKEAVDPSTIRMNTTVENIRQTPDEVFVTFSDGSREVFDLVVGCDGVRSRTRSMVFGLVPLTYSGMRGWSFWVKSGIQKTAHIAEYWGTGKFLGVWPTKGRLSVFTSIRSPEGSTHHVESGVRRIGEHFKDFGGIVPDILAGLDDESQIYFDDYNDLRMDKWYKGRVVLAGDSAHAVLPTAGGGVSMAIESAAVLADELSRADSKYIAQALESYELRRRPRVIKIQDQSRMMGKVAFANSRLLSVLRNFVMRFYSNRLHVKYWDSMLKEPI
ncbi:MAG TPA: FAD-dependent monooxygenase [Thermodesulfobacteriota bacterium]|nr:FAD-dependent monooxygenase [Thermodesulfobacteriota bacterium]